MVTFNRNQAKQLLAMFGGEDASITVHQDCDTIRAYYSDYPEEGSEELLESWKDNLPDKNAALIEARCWLQDDTTPEKAGAKCETKNKLMQFISDAIG